MTNLLFVSYSSKISSNRVSVTLHYVLLLTSVSSIHNLKAGFELTSSVLFTHLKAVL
ncbi:Uncharacterised protein [Streptococcus pneumoniae]|nr:Uncharacterised protein [Streptococcus pneumoniae]